MKKHNMDLANICHKLDINPFYIVLVLGIALIFGVPLILTYLNIPPFFILLIWVVILLSSAISFLIYFYRNPERDPPKNENVIVSPADGMIVYIKKINKGEIPFPIKGKNIISIRSKMKKLLMRKLFLIQEKFFIIIKRVIEKTSKNIKRKS